MKKIVFMLTAIIIAISLAGCSSNSTVPKPTPTPTLSAEQKKYNEIKQGVIKQFETTVDVTFDTSKLTKTEAENLNNTRDFYIGLITDEIYACYQNKVTDEECNKQVGQYLEQYFLLAYVATQTPTPTPTTTPDAMAIQYEKTKTTVSQWLDKAVYDIYDKNQHSSDIVTKINQQKEVYVNNIMVQVMKQVNGEMTIEQLTDKVNALINEYQIFVLATIS